MLLDHSKFLHSAKCGVCNVRVPFVFTREHVSTCLECWIRGRYCHYCFCYDVFEPLDAPFECYDCVGKKRAKDRTCRGPSWQKPKCQRKPQLPLISPSICIEDFIQRTQEIVAKEPHVHINVCCRCGDISSRLHVKAYVAIKYKHLLMCGDCILPILISRLLKHISVVPLVTIAIEFLGLSSVQNTDNADHVD
jgi:hypothetical protein